MKLIEPISSALLLTGCIYAAGNSQNASFMRWFGVQPEFSQPPVDKVLYDGGLIAFELFYRHLQYIFGLWAYAVPIALFITISYALSYKALSTQNRAKLLAWTKVFFNHFPVGLVLLSYLIYLTFMSWQKGQDDGVILAKIYSSKCIYIEISKDKKTETGCMFRKDKDSIWYYNRHNGEYRANSKLITESDIVRYLGSYKNNKSDEATSN